MENLIKILDPKGVYGYEFHHFTRDLKNIPAGIFFKSLGAWIRDLAFRRPERVRTSPFFQRPLVKGRRVVSLGFLPKHHFHHR